ncbi:MAG: hypothetical protein ACK494_00465, partial [Planctomycetota bacterium]
NLWRSQISDRGVAFLVRLPLKRLNLDDTSVGNGAIAFIAQIKSLEFLHLGKTAITEDGIQGLQGLSNLKDLIVTNIGLGSAAVQQLRGHFPKTNIKY